MSIHATVKRILWTLEELAAGYERCGLPRERARYCALVVALVLEGWPRPEAEQFAREYVPRSESEKIDECTETN
jgi:hypothetical protein